MNEFETAMVNKPSVFGCTCLFQRERKRERERERERGREREREGWGGERDQGRIMGKGMGVSEVHALSHHPTLNSLSLVP